MKQMFDSAVRSAGDFAGVFECETSVAYFYLYQISKDEEENKILDQLRIFTRKVKLVEKDISIRWSFDEKKVGLFIKEVLWAAFDLSTNSKHGGDYKEGGKSEVPETIVKSFQNLLAD